ncbi:hypothetical protein C2E23DRAFT_857093 [Lenzites betulinus]|nr:hypothetical protein C2E23DRAFT_857093 [Lenzites betulinus]
MSLSSFSSTSSATVTSPSLFATVTQTSPTPHGPPPKLIVALSTSLGLVLLVAVAAAAMLCYRRRRRRAATRNTAQADSIVVHTPQESMTGDESGITFDKKADISANESASVVYEPAVGIPFDPTTAVVDSTDRPCDMPTTPSTANATASYAAGPYVQDVPMAILGVEEPGKVSASSGRREYEPLGSPPVDPPLPSSIPLDNGVPEDRLPSFVSTSQAPPAQAYTQHERRFVTVLMEVEDGDGEGSYVLDQPPPYQPRPREVVGDPSEGVLADAGRSGR